MRNLSRCRAFSASLRNWSARAGTFWFRKTPELHERTPIIKCCRREDAPVKVPPLEEDFFVAGKEGAKVGGLLRSRAGEGGPDPEPVRAQFLVVERVALPN